MSWTEAARILRAASAIQNDVRAAGLAPVAWGRADTFDALITDAELRKTTRQLFEDGHYALAVEEAYKCVNNVVKRRAGTAADGAPLMENVFSAGNPVLRLNPLRTESQRNQQIGYMRILAGCMVGIRNPRAHEHRYLDDPQVALEMLVWANHLIRMVRGARRRRTVQQRAAGRIQ